MTWIDEARARQQETHHHLCKCWHEDLTRALAVCEAAERMCDRVQERKASHEDCQRFRNAIKEDATILRAALDGRTQ